MGQNSGDRNAAIRSVEHELGVLSRRIKRSTAVRARMINPDLPGTSYSMLSALHANGPQRSSALADEFAIDKGAVSRQIARLEELGLVDRQPDPEDGRAHLLRITPPGRECIDEIERQRRDWYRNKLAEWDVDELGQLAEVLSRYNGALETP